MSILKPHLSQVRFYYVRTCGRALSHPLQSAFNVHQRYLFSKPMNAFSPVGRLMHLSRCHMYTSGERTVYVSGSMARGGSASPRGRYGGGFAVTKIQLFLQYAKFRAFKTCKDMLKKWHFSLKNCKICHNSHYASELRDYALLHVNKMQLYNFTTLQH